MGVCPSSAPSGVRRRLAEDSPDKPWNHTATTRGVSRLPIYRTVSIAAAAKRAAPSCSQMPSQKLDDCGAPPNITVGRTMSSVPVKAATIDAPSAKVTFSPSTGQLASAMKMGFTKKSAVWSPSGRYGNAAYARLKADAPKMPLISRRRKFSLFPTTLANRSLAVLFAQPFTCLFTCMPVATVIIPEKTDLTRTTSIAGTVCSSTFATYPCSA
mmetsp:Transcript_10181/g.27316  ORF Transcript_10181/g.27316 Transcript_10181/m.27316 type:complete len:213 (-) Transcript_10181:351-989(-)